MKELFTALCKAQRELGHVYKDAKGYNYRYATLDGVIDCSREILTKNGLSVIQLLNGQDVVTMLCHESGEFVQSTTPIVLTQDAKRPLEQQYGSSVTYMRRYALLSIICLATSEDTDCQPTPSPAIAPTPAAASKPVTPYVFNLPQIIATFKQAKLEISQVELFLQKPAAKWCESDAPALKKAFETLTLKKGQ